MISARYRAIAATVLVLVLAPSAHAQARWTDVGVTSIGNHVSVDTRSVKRQGGLVSATIRVLFTPAVQTPQGPWASSQTKATVDCAKHTLAARENAYFADAQGRRLTQRKVNQVPGYGPVLKGSMGEIAVTWLCRAR